MDKNDYSGWDLGFDEPTTKNDISKKKEKREIFNKISFSFSSEKIKVFNVVSLLLVFLLVVSILVGLMYTKSDKLKIITFGTLDDIRYVRYMGDHIETMSSMLDKYRGLRKENSLTVQSKTVDYIGELKRIRTNHLTVKTSYENTHKLGMDLISSYEEMFSVLASYKTAISAKEANNLKVKMKNIEIKSTSLLKAYKAQYSELEKNIYGGDK